MADIDQEIDHNSAFRKWMNYQETQRMQEEAQKQWEDEKQKLKDDLTPEMVNDIREWRCVEDYTWRAIATAFYEKYKDFSYSHSILPSNQINGMMICGVAQDLLKQENSEGWN
jgi:hypothetical protein